MQRTRIAMVGAGGVARRHAEVLGGFEDVELVGVTDVRADAAAALAAEAGTSPYEDLPRLVEHAAPDAVYVCVPPFAHGEPERLLIDHGIPMFVEKPLAAGLDVAEELAAAIGERGLLTATGYHWRYRDAVGRAKALLEAAEPRLAIASWLDKVPPVAWWLQRERSGGQVVEQATHLLDVLLDLVGPVEEVQAIASSRPRAAFPGADLDDVTAATLRFAGGAVGTLAATSLLPRKHRAAVELVCDGLRIELSETRLAVDDGDEPVVHADGDAEAKRRVDRAFVDAVQGRGDDVRAPYAVALETHRVACAIARSAREGASVTVAG